MKIRHELRKSFALRAAMIAWPANVAGRAALAAGGS
jgi:hypothetical protein